MLNERLFKRVFTQFRRIYLKFTELNLSEELLSSIERSGFEEATPIQEATIPLDRHKQVPGKQPHLVYLCWKRLIQTMRNYKD